MAWAKGRSLRDSIAAAHSSIILTSWLHNGNSSTQDRPSLSTPVPWNLPHRALAKLIGGLTAPRNRAGGVWAFAMRPPATVTYEPRHGKGPPLPKPDAAGNYPALESMRVLLARDIIGARRRLGLTQAELARRAGVRPETLNRLEQGKHTASTATMNKLDRALREALNQPKPKGTSRFPRAPRESRLARDLRGNHLAVDKRRGGRESPTSSRHN